MLATQLEMTSSNSLPAGFTVRSVTMDDLETAVSVFNAVSLVQTGLEMFSLEEIEAEWKHEDFDKARSTRAIFTPDGILVAYIEVWDTDPVPVSPWVWGRVHPNYEGLGLGTYLLTWAEERAREAILRSPEEARVTMRCGCISTYEPANALLSGYGMVPNRSFWTMVVDLAEEPKTAVFPPGIRVTTLTELNNLRAVAHATDDAFKDHWGYVEQPEEEHFRQWQTWVDLDPHFDPSLWFLAMDGDEIAGVSLCRLKASEDPNMGWVNTLGVRRAWRRRGLAQALLQHSFCELYRLGQHSVGLGVDAESLTGATRLYEKAGMYVKRQFISYEKELRPGIDLATRSMS